MENKSEVILKSVSPSSHPFSNEQILSMTASFMPTNKHKKRNTMLKTGIFIIVIASGLTAYLLSTNEKNVKIDKGYKSGNVKQFTRNITEEKIETENDSQNIDYFSDNSASNVSTANTNKANSENATLLKKSESSNPKYKLAYSASQLPIMHFTNEELEQLVPGSIESDTVFRLYYERVGDKNFFSKWVNFDYNKIKYNDKFLMPAYQRYTENGSSSPHFDHSRARLPEEYNRALYSNVAQISSSGYLIMSRELSSMVSYYREDYREYHMRSTNKGKWIYDFRNQGRDDKIEEYEHYIDSVSTIFSKELVPVRINPLSDLYFILWFLPTEDFIDKLPLRYREDFRHVNQFYQSYNKEQISLDEYCESIDGKLDFFQVCPDKDNESLTVLASLGKEGVEVDIDSKVDESIKISIINIHGQLIYETGYKLYSAGQHYLTIPLEKYYLGGVYFIAVENERGTLSYERISLIR